MKSKMYMLIASFSIAILFLFGCNDEKATNIKSEKIQINQDLHLIISELDKTMNNIRGDIYQSQIDPNIDHLSYLNKIENHRHDLSKLLNRLKFVNSYKWNEYKTEVIREISHSKKTLKMFVNY